MSTALTHAEDTQITASNGRIALEPNPRRIRAFFAGHAVADTTRSVYLFERGRLPMYYIPLADVRTEFLVPTSTTCSFHGIFVVLGPRNTKAEECSSLYHVQSRAFLTEIQIRVRSIAKP